MPVFEAQLEKVFIKAKDECVALQVAEQLVKHGELTNIAVAKIDGIELTELTADQGKIVNASDVPLPRSEEDENHYMKCKNCHERKRDVALSWNLDVWICDKCMSAILDKFVIHAKLKEKVAGLEKKNADLENWIRVTGRGPIRYRQDSMEKTIYNIESAVAAQMVSPDGVTLAQIREKFHECYGKLDDFANRSNHQDDLFTAFMYTVLKGK